MDKILPGPNAWYYFEASSFQEWFALSSIFAAFSWSFTRLNKMAVSLIQ